MHFPGHLREAFVEWVEDEMPPEVEMHICHGGFNNPEARWEWQTWPAEKLLGKLVHCSDIMPGDLCEELELERGSTYARAAQRLLAGRRRMSRA